MLRVALFLIASHLLLALAPRASSGGKAPRAARALRPDLLHALPAKLDRIAVVPIPDGAKSELLVRLTSKRRHDLTITACGGTIIMSSPTPPGKDAYTGRHWETVTPRRPVTLRFSRGERATGGLLVYVDGKTSPSPVTVGHPVGDATISERNLNNFSVIGHHIPRHKGHYWPSEEELTALYATLDEGFFGYATAALVERGCEKWPAGSGAPWSPVRKGERLLLVELDVLVRQSGERLVCPIMRDRGSRSRLHVFDCKAHGGRNPMLEFRQANGKRGFAYSDWTDRSRCRREGR